MVLRLEEKTGFNPCAGLLQARDGNLYGTASQGGIGGAGTVYRLDINAGLSVLHSFSGSDGSDPRAALIQAADGCLYGTTTRGGVASDESIFGQVGNGTVFQITLDGALTTLHSFEGDDDSGARLLQASDGYLYGTTNGGMVGHGTVFQVGATGAFTTLHTFSGTDGSNPSAGLIQADGNLYGTTLYGGTYNRGTVFRITPDGTLTTLYAFNHTDGAGPGGLARGKDGHLYGVTTSGGDYDAGTVFHLVPDGALFTAYCFKQSEGFSPVAGLLLATDGNLYGTTCKGGTHGYGTIFRITPDGGLITLYAFNGEDGSSPNAYLIQVSDGDLYGTTTLGGEHRDESMFGSSGYGTVFKCTLDGALTTLYSFRGAEDMFRWGGSGSVFHVTAPGGGFGLTIGTPLEGEQPGNSFVVSGDLGENLLLEDASLPETSIESCRGIESLDVNDAMLLVRAPVEQVAQAFSSLRHVDVWRRDAYERPVPGMALSFVVYQLRGHSWSVIWTLTEAPFMHGFDLPDAEALSRLLQTRAVLYTVSDTCCSIGYDLYEQGELVEKLFYEPGSEEEDLAPSEFYSRLRPVQAHDIEDSYNFVEAFMLEQDTYVPALLNSYRGSAALRLEGYRADRHIGDTSYSPDHFTRSDFERLDYLGIDKAALPAGEWQRLGANQYR